MTVSILYQGITPLCTPDLLPLPGQDADEIALLHDMLLVECKPRNLIERQWIYDLALLMGRIAYIRLTRQGLHLVNQRKVARDIVHPRRMPDHYLLQRLVRLSAVNPIEYTPEEVKKLEEHLRAGFKIEPEHLDDSSDLYARILGLDLQENLVAYTQLDALEQNLLRERDRVIAQFDRRRREEVAGTVTKIEHKTAPGIAQQEQLPRTATSQ